MTDFVTAFSQSDASVGLVLGSFFADLVITILLYVVRKVLPFRDCMALYPGGLQSHGSGNPDPDLCMDLEEL